MTFPHSFATLKSDEERSGEAIAAQPERKGRTGRRQDSVTLRNGDRHELTKNRSKIEYDDAHGHVYELPVLVAGFTDTGT